LPPNGVLQSPVVEPEFDGKKPTGNYLVTIGEGRRLAQLLRAKRKEITKSEPIRCILDTARNASRSASPRTPAAERGSRRPRAKPHGNVGDLRHDFARAA
jgi:hypothetical protein